MKTSLQAACLLLSMTGVGRAEGPLATPAPEFDPAVKLSLMALPPTQDVQLIGNVIRYTNVAKAWWIEMRCHVAEPGEADAFKADVAAYTGMMRALFHQKFDAAPDKAEEYAEKIQMYALEEMSAANFFGCDARAKSAFAPGYAETQRLATFLASHQVP
jgi:hypothetical protein